MKKLFLVLGIGVVVLFGLIGVLCLGFFGLMLVLPEEPTLDVRLSAPETVAVGEEFDLVLRTRNLHDAPIQLDSIDIDLEFLEGFDVVSVDPTPADSMEIIGQRSWSFTQTVAPGEELDVTYKLAARKPGYYSGDIDVCNPNQDWTTVVPNIDVVAE